MRALRTLAAAVGITVAMALVAPAAATAQDQLVLPAPTGRHPVGAVQLHLVDHDRLDPWVPTGPRELMVSLWYPAAASRGDRVPYATAEESRLLLASYGLTDLPPDALTHVRTHARAGAPPLRAAHPLVVLSPGFGLPRWTLTALAEDLASRGYVVAGVDHTYESAATTFPDGRVAECLTCDGAVSVDVIGANRAVDISFVLDRLLAGYHRLIDPHRIAVVGHSLGGAAAAMTMLADRRVDAGIDLDGTFHPELTRDIARPFLMVGAGEHGLPGTDVSWDGGWQHLTGWRHWLYVPAMTHLSPTDTAVVGEWLGVDVQAMDGTRAVDITRTYVRAFLDQHLRHHPQPLLTAPSPRFPEVDFVA
jgi:dienelactone hydrolase